MKNPFAALLVATAIAGCHSLPDPVYYPVDDWTPDNPTDDARKECIDSLYTRRASIKRQSLYQDIMVLLGGTVSAAGGITAAALAQSDAESTPTTASAVVAAAGALAALASKLGTDPSVDTNIHARKRKHYDAAMLIYRRYNKPASMPNNMREYTTDRFQACSSPDPAQDPPPAPATPDAVP